jgi:alpha-tubulin suppressor-like RCC1 family protein
MNPIYQVALATAFLLAGPATGPAPITISLLAARDTSPGGNLTLNDVSATPAQAELVSAADTGSGVTFIATGMWHTCAILASGAGDCWGYNGLGELGNGSTTDSSVPVSVSGLSGAATIAAGTDQTCAVLSGGAVKCWGYNFDGELGNGTTTDSSVPVSVSGLSGATAIAEGGDHSCALLSGGTVKCWGYNVEGELGNGTTTSSSVPVSVSGLSGATAIAAGGYHSCALLSGGAVKCWGDNSGGDLGNGTTTSSSVPVSVSSLSGAIAIAAGGSDTCALLSGGAVKCWGGNSSGQLGNGSTTNSSVPVSVSGLSGANAIAAADMHTCAIVAGAGKCWGYNYYGELGNGTTTDSSVPVSVSGLSGATAVAAGGSHTCALLAGYAVECWGLNGAGELGNGTTTNSSVPVAVVGISTSELGPGNAYWDAYYKDSANTSTWSAFCTAGGATFTADANGVPACTPSGSTHIAVPPADTDNVYPGFQCAELAQRYLYVTYGWPGVLDSAGHADNGDEIVSTYAVRHSNDAVVVPNGSGSHPAQGDVISFSAASNFNSPSGGHVAIVTGVSVNGTTGTVTIVGQNQLSPYQAGPATLTMSKQAGAWTIDYTSFDSTLPYIEWLHVTIPSASQSIGPSGGTVSLAGGTPSLSVPSAALSFNATVRLTQLQPSDPPDPLGPGLTLAGLPVDVMLPALVAGSSAQLTLPFDPSQVPVGASLAIFQDGAWTMLPTTYSGDTLTAAITESGTYAPLAYPSGAVSGATYTALTPTRLLDSRDGTGGLGIFHSHVAQTFQVTGGSSGVPANATAVTGNLTVTQQNAMGFLYIGPVPMNNPTSSTLNFPLGDDRANAVTVSLGAGGTLSITYAAPTLGPTAHAIFDVTGFFTPDTGGATYTALTPKRLLDSRDGTGGATIFSSHAAQHFQVTGGTSGVPANATAVTGNLTVTEQSSLGFLYIGPAQADNPTSSTLNFPEGDDRANAVTVALGSGGVLWVTYAAPTLGPTAHVIFDVTGYFTPGMGGATYVALTPTRLLDTRDGTGSLGVFSSHLAQHFQVTGGSGGVPGGAIAVTGNLTVTQQSRNGFLYIGPYQADNPTSSTLNFPYGDDRANAVTVALGTGGVLWVTYAAPTLGPTAHVIFDVTGYFMPASI